MSGETKPATNKVVVIVFGPPASGKSQLSQDVIDFLTEHDLVAEHYVFTTNDADAVRNIMGLAQDGGVQA